MSLYAPDENSARKREKDDTGETSLSRNWSISLFSRSAFILSVIHRDKWKIQSHAGSAALTLMRPGFLSAYLSVYTGLR